MFNKWSSFIFCVQKSDNNTLHFLPPVDKNDNYREILSSAATTIHQFIFTVFARRSYFILYKLSSKDRIGLIFYIHHFVIFVLQLCWNDGHPSKRLHLRQNSRIELNAWERGLSSASFRNDIVLSSASHCWPKFSFRGRAVKSRSFRMAATSKSCLASFSQCEFDNAFARKLDHKYPFKSDIYFCLKERRKLQVLWGSFFSMTHCHELLNRKNTFLIRASFLKGLTSEWTCQAFSSFQGEKNFRKKMLISSASGNALANKNTYSMKEHREILQTEWATFAPCLAHISAKRQDIELKIWAQFPRFSPNRRSKFQSSWTNLDSDRFSTGEGTRRC